MDPADLPTEKSWPSRSIIVLAVALSALVGKWLWQRRKAFADLLFSDDEQPPVQPLEGP
jgi:hypothetical protein